MKQKLMKCVLLWNQYLPVKPCTATETLPNGDELTYDDFHVHPIIMKRDLLTILHVKGAQLLHSNHENKVDHLESYYFLQKIYS